MKISASPPQTYTVELTFDEMVRIWMLSYMHEGGDMFPKYTRLNDDGGMPDEVVREGLRRRRTPGYTWSAP